MTLTAVSKNQEQVAPAATDSSEQPAQPPQKKPWQRMEGESLLWFNRFSLYLALGYKRTLLAALHKEQEKAKVLSSTKSGQKATTKGSVKEVSNQQANPRKNPKNPVLAEVPAPKREQVPSSWKIAAQKWKWKERAAAWDEYVVEHSVEQHLQHFMEGASLSVNRVIYLKTFLKSLLDTLNKQSSSMTFEQHIAYFARMQSILRDIREEMKDYDEALARVLLQQDVRNEYTGMTADMLEARRKEQPR